LARVARDAALERRFRHRREYIPVGCAATSMSPTLPKAPFEIHVADGASSADRKVV
jgi:hypothetical protein